MGNQPLISVIISTYGRNEMLQRAIASVLNQSYKNFELIVVHDGEESDFIISATADKVTHIYLDKHTGTDAKPKNTAILASKGEYIAYLDDDNEFHPYHLEVLLKAFEKNPELDVAYCDMWLYDQSNPKDPGQQGIAMDFDPQFLLNRNYIDTSMVMHKRDIVFAVGGWDETLPRFKDWNLFVRMAKWGAKFQRVPIIATSYYIHENNSAKAHPVHSWIDPLTGLTFYKPTFDPAGCFIHLPYLGRRTEEEQPGVAIFTITYDRLDYTKRMQKSLASSTNYHFDWYVIDNGSKDGTQEWLLTGPGRLIAGRENKTNMGLTAASNQAIDLITGLKKYQIVIKVDNDCEFMTKQWLESIVDLWKRNHMLYMSPYPEGLVHNPGGAPRVGYSYIGPYMVEVTQHIGGICAAIDSRAYSDFRWKDQFLHGNQDREASIAFMKKGYMPMYLPLHRIKHMDTTEGQYKKYPEYFERRKGEKTQTYEN